jgi:hypothetical protein
MTTAKQALAAHRAAWAVRSAQLKASDRLRNEGGEGYSSYERASEANFAAELPLIEAAFAQEWTLEVLTARRAAWNAQVVKCKSHADMAKLAKSLGYSHTDLAKAKTLHGVA